MEIFFFFYYSTCLQPPAEVLPKGWSFNLRPQDKKSSKAQKSISCMCLLHAHKKKPLLAWSCLQWWLSLKVVQSLWSEHLYISLDIFKLCAFCCCQERCRLWLWRARFTRLEQNVWLHGELHCRLVRASLVPPCLACWEGLPKMLILPFAAQPPFQPCELNKTALPGWGFQWTRNESVNWDRSFGFDLCWQCLLERGKAAWQRVFLFRSKRSCERPSLFTSWWITANCWLNCLMHSPKASKGGGRSWGF